MLVERTVEHIINASRFDVEIVLSGTESTLCQFDNGVVAVSGDSPFLGIRVTSGRRSGFASCSDTKDWKKTLSRATKVMKVSEQLEFKPTLATKAKFPKVSCGKALWNLGEAETISMFMRMCDVEPPIVSASLEKRNMKFHFANSNGVDSHHQCSCVSAHIEVSESGISAFESHTDTKPLDVEKISGSAVELCRQSQKPVDFETKKMRVLLDYFALAALLEKAVIPSFLASMVHKNRSKLAGKVGKVLFSRDLSLNDVGTKYLNASPSDAEGTPRSTTELVGKGRLLGFLYDRYSAQKDGVKSTGNCGSLASRPSVVPSNIVVERGNGSFSGRYLHVHSISGAHTANSVSGDFSVNVNNAFLVDKDMKPVKHAMLSGNVFELLNKIECIGKKSRQEGVVRTPPIMFSNVQVIA